MGWFDNYIVKTVFTPAAQRTNHAPYGYISGGDPEAGVYMLERTKWSVNIKDAMVFDSKEDAKYFVKQFVKAFKAEKLDINTWIESIEYIPVKDRY